MLTAINMSTQAIKELDAISFITKLPDYEVYFFELTTQKAHFKYENILDCSIVYKTNGTLMLNMSNEFSESSMELTVDGNVEVKTLTPCKIKFIHKAECTLAHRAQRNALDTFITDVTDMFVILGVAIHQKTIAEANGHS
ncbi:hypothetical protein [Photobacterium kishitanii]|uniref:Uncharacterized protein n=1 Tax=Photobacterium kishitanii TaxID=318456 RepID=A0A2T3KKY6_9GAMM|nr:hypothetical protein [Photobacterium kishitanii]PSV00307.1 hypothetical protein C9J27_04065 [Photobacterium kishitanii]